MDDSSYDDAAVTPIEVPAPDNMVMDEDDDEEEGQLTIDESRADYPSTSSAPLAEPSAPVEEEETSPPPMEMEEEEEEAQPPSLEMLVMQSKQAGLSGEELIQ